MEGVAERDKRLNERVIAQGWWTERFAREDKLKPLMDYLKPKTPQSGDEVLAVFREYEARGVPISIKRFAPDGSELN